MLDFAVFDSILDSIFVIDRTGRITYCNDAAATFCETSVRRVVGKVFLQDVIQFAEVGIVPFTEESVGRNAPTPFIETAYHLPKATKAGKVQLAVRPIDANHWGVFIKDVSLEETLAAKYRNELAKTEEYARNLEKLVEARTVELRGVNQTLNAILDSLGQGFFTFDASGTCGSVYTKVCEDILEGVPLQRKAWEVLSVPPSEIPQFSKWMETVFAEPLPFDDLRGLGPNLFPHSKSRYVVLDYFPIRRDTKKISEIVVVATDKTTEHQAQLDLETERHFAAMIVKFLKNREQFTQFLQSIPGTLAQLRQLFSAESPAENLAEAYRVLHTLEGESGTFSLNEFRLLARSAQQVLEPFKDSRTISADGIRAVLGATARIGEVYDKFIAENSNLFQLDQLKQGRRVEIAAENVQAFLQKLQRMPDSSKLVEEYVDYFLKVPIESQLKYFDGLVQSVAVKLGKQVKPLEIEGGQVRIQQEAYQGLFSALVHAFRNAVDHGLEDPLEREWAGKDPKGLIRVKVEIDNDHLYMTVSDDGKGIDPERLRGVLKTKFPTRDFSQATDVEVMQSVFLPGFSSRESVGEFSGRGVGLDALREEVLNRGGTVHIRSTVGEGTAIVISLPEPMNPTALLRSA